MEDKDWEDGIEEDRDRYDTLSPRARARQVKRDRGVCYDCSNPAIPGQARCEKCAKRARERQRIYDYDKSHRYSTSEFMGAWENDCDRSRKRTNKVKETAVINNLGSTDRDFYEEGCEAYISGSGDTPPSDVSEYGPDAEAEWLSGYEDSQYIAQDEDYDGEC